jgi:hypothetical protein
VILGQADTAWYGITLAVRIEVARIFRAEEVLDSTATFSVRYFSLVNSSFVSDVTFPVVCCINFHVGITSSS